MNGTIRNHPRSVQRGRNFQFYSHLVLSEVLNAQLGIEEPAGWDVYKYRRVCETERERRGLRPTSPCPSQAPGAQSPRAMGRKILRCLLLGFTLDSPDQTQRVISSVTDDRVKCSLCRRTCHKVPERKQNPTSVFRLTAMENKCPFPILGFCLSFICLISSTRSQGCFCLSYKKRRQIEIQKRSWRNGLWV